MNSGKPKDQSLAIAYSMAKRKKQNEYHGGMIEDDSSPTDELDRIKDEDGAPDEEETMFAKGGSVAEQIRTKSKGPAMEPELEEAKEPSDDDILAQDMLPEDEEDMKFKSVAERIRHGMKKK